MSFFIFFISYIVLSLSLYGLLKSNSTEDKSSNRTLKYVGDKQKKSKVEIVNEMAKTIKEEMEKERRTHTDRHLVTFTIKPTGKFRERLQAIPLVPSINENELIHQLRKTVFFDKPVPFQPQQEENSIYIKAKLNGNDGEMQLMTGKKLLACCQFGLSEKRIKAVGFQNFSEVNQYLVREFFHTVLENHSEELVNTQIETRKALSSSNRGIESLESDIKDLQKTIDVMIKTLRNEEEYIDDIEIKHNLTHHYEKPINDMVDLFCSLSEEGKKKMYPDVIRTFESCKNELKRLFNEKEERTVKKLQMQVKLLEERTTQ